jgi:hypothetical protein
MGYPAPGFETLHLVEQLRLCRRCRIGGEVHFADHLAVQAQREGVFASDRPVPGDVLHRLGRVGLPERNPVAGDLNAEDARLLALAEAGLLPGACHAGAAADAVIRQRHGVRCAVWRRDLRNTRQLLVAGHGGLGDHRRGFAVPGGRDRITRASLDASCHGAARVGDRLAEALQLGELLAAGGDSEALGVGRDGIDDPVEVHRSGIALPRTIPIGGRRRTLRDTGEGHSGCGNGRRDAKKLLHRKSIEKEFLKMIRMGSGPMESAALGSGPNNSGRSPRDRSWFRPSDRSATDRMSRHIYPSDVQRVPRWWTVVGVPHSAPKSALARNPLPSPAL